VEEKSSSTFIGCIGLNRPNFQAHFTPAVEVGWRLARPFWGKGYATEAAKKAIEYGFEEVNLSEIVSFTAKINERSIAVMKRLEMTHNCKENFNHPNLPSGHILEPHVLYRLRREQWKAN
jgi:ribosomal-protein-alanine N-acetyltransferase